MQKAPTYIFDGVLNTFLPVVQETFSYLHYIDNKAKGRISTRKQSTPNFRIGGIRIFVFRKICCTLFFVTSVLRFALLLYYWPLNLLNGLLLRVLGILKSFQLLNGTYRLFNCWKSLYLYLYHIAPHRKRKQWK